MLGYKFLLKLTADLPTERNNAPYRQKKATFTLRMSKQNIAILFCSVVHAFFELMADIPELKLTCHPVKDSLRGGEKIFGDNRQNFMGCKKRHESARNLTRGMQLKICWSIPFPKANKK